MTAPISQVSAIGQQNPQLVRAQQTAALAGPKVEEAIKELGDWEKNSGEWAHSKSPNKAKHDALLAAVETARANNSQAQFALKEAESKYGQSAAQNPIKQIGVTDPSAVQKLNYMA